MNRTLRCFTSRSETVDDDLAEEGEKMRARRSPRRDEDGGGPGQFRVVFYHDQIIIEPHTGRIPKDALRVCICDTMSEAREIMMEAGR